MKPSVSFNASHSGLDRSVIPLSEEEERNAAIVVAGRVSDPDELSKFLDMLGLLEDDE